MLETNSNSKTIQDLPPIPSKRYFTIGEVSDLCAVKPHVLRYWEQEFPQLKPSKRRGNRRYYQHHDVMMIREIRELLYEQGFTIGGARQKLTASTANGTKKVEADMPVQANETQPATTVAAPSTKDQPEVNKLVSELCRELEDLLSELDS